MGFNDATTGGWIESIRDLLIDGWTPANTDDKTPEIKLITDESLPRDIRPDNLHSYVLFYEVSADSKRADTYYYGESREMKIAVDVRCWSRSRQKKIMLEVERILMVNRRDPLNSGGQSIGINVIEWQGWEDLSNRNHKMQWWVAHILCYKAYVSLT